LFEKEFVKCCIETSFLNIRKKFKKPKVSTKTFDEKNFGLNGKILQIKRAFVRF